MNVLEGPPQEDSAASVRDHSNIKLLFRIQTPDFGSDGSTFTSHTGPRANDLEKSQNLFLHPVRIVVRLNLSHKEPTPQ